MYPAFTVSYYFYIFCIVQIFMLSFRCNTCIFSLCIIKDYSILFKSCSLEASVTDNMIKLQLPETQTTVLPRCTSALMR